MEQEYTLGFTRAELETLLAACESEIVHRYRGPYKDTAIKLRDKLKLFLSNLPK